MKIFRMVCGVNARWIPGPGNSNYFRGVPLGKSSSSIGFYPCEIKKIYSTEEDIDDALFVVKKFDVKPEEIKKISGSAIKKSPKDTVLFAFKRNLEIFLKKL